MQLGTDYDGDTLPTLPGVAEAPGAQLGSYRLLEILGEGGFGTVFRAEQSQPVKRHVALKILKLGMDTRQVVARFEAERQALALMAHPAIAKVYDAGATDTGRPYFVMELVEGEPVSHYCDKRDLTTRERLLLFGDVCMAVQHAHQKGVLHRDLKPSNVLVTEVDGVPLPKVIDFGIAKAIEGPLTEVTVATEAFQVMGTLEYMPPEQAAGRDVDTRVDVYALGALLYELVTGTPPFAAGPGDGLDHLSERLRQIHEVIPPKPSTRVRELGASTSHDLRGDLDWIVMKALEKDRERRYSSAAELADDIGRHLANEPVLASPPSRTYRLRKFVRRNRLVVGSIAIVGITLVVATAALAGLYARSVLAEEQATREAETSRRALSFMTEMFEVSDPSQARGATVTAREILDRGAERIERELVDQPEIRSTLAATMGNVYRGLGLYERAEELVSSAASTRRELDGEEDPESLRLSAGIADLWSRQSRLEESEELLRETLERQRSVLGPDHVDVLHSQLTLCHVLAERSEFGEAEALARETLESARRTLGEEHELSLLALTRLALAYDNSGRFEDAEQELLQVLQLRNRAFGEDHPDTLIVVAQLAELYMRMGRFEDAEGLFEDAQEVARHVFGDEHPEFLLYRAKLGLLYFEMGRWAEAEELYGALIGAQRRTLGDQHLDTLLAINTLGAVMSNQGRLDEAERHYSEALTGLLRVVGEESEHALSIRGNMAVLYLQMDRLKEAETWARKAHEGSRALYGEDHPSTLLRLENLGNVLYQLGDEAGTVALLEEVLAARRRSLGNEHPAVTRTLVNLSVVLGTIGDLAGGMAVREELLERTQAGLGFDYASVAEEIEQLSRDFVGLAEYEGAAECLVEVLRIRQEVLGPEDPLTLRAMRDHLAATIELGRWAELETIGRECHEAHVLALGASDALTLQCVRLIVGAYVRNGDEGLAEAWQAELGN